MAQSLTLSNVAFPQGSQQFAINGLPPAANGFQLRAKRDASWVAPGHLFDLLVEISPDGGITWSPWINGSMDGGPATVGRDGTTDASWSGLWPGVLSGDGVTRAQLKQTDVRITVNAARAFTSPQVSVIPI